MIRPSSLSRAKAICDREVAAGKLSADWYRRDELERLIAGHAEAQARDDERATANTNSASADQGGKRHVESSALRAPVEPDAPVARTAGRAEHPTAPRRSTPDDARRAA